MIIWAGSVLGVVMGLLHGAYVFEKISHPVPGKSPPDYLRGLYYATWVLLLWVVFGVYLLVFWCAGVIFYALIKAFR